MFLGIFHELCLCVLSFFGHRLIITCVFFCSKKSVLIEKILRTEPDVGKIYLLIKAKNKESALKRLKSEVRSL